MKKLICVLTAAALCLCLVACGAKTEEAPAAETTETVGMPNPAVEYASLEEVNEKLGSRLAKPATMGVSDESFSIIGEGAEAIGQYRFTMAGYACTLRFAPVFDTDISGVYVENGTIFEGTSAGELAYGAAENTLLARWATVDGQYVLMVEGSSYTEEEFAAIAEEMRSLTIPEDSDGETIGMPNPVVEYASLAEVNEKLGGRLVKPVAMGVTEESFCTIGEGAEAIGQYRFKLAGFGWEFRFSPAFDTDISGVYTANGTVFEGKSAGELEYGAAEDIRLARWATVDGQYVLMVEGSEYSDEDFASIAEEMRGLTIPEDSDGETIGMPNPMVACDSLEALNEKLGSRLAKPATMGVTDEAFYTIGEGAEAIAQYNYTLAGYAWTFRFSPVFDTDISGVYTEEGTVFEGTSAGEFETGAADDMLLARWATVDGQYVLVVEGSAYTEEEFASIAQEMRALTIPEES